MNFHELNEHLRNKKPFIVYGDVCRYDPAIHVGDPHEWYRAEIRKANIAVNVESQDEYLKQQRLLLDKLDALQARLTLTESALSAAGKLLDVLEMKDITCHKEVGDYHLAKARWDGAREALHGVTK